MKTLAKLTLAVAVGAVLVRMAMFLRRRAATSENGCGQALPIAVVDVASVPVKRIADEGVPAANVSTVAVELPLLTSTSDRVAVSSAVKATRAGEQTRIPTPAHAASRAALPVAGLFAALVAAIAFGAISAGSANGSTALQPGTQVEAELGVLVAPMAIVSDPTASGRKYITQNSTIGVGYADYDVYVLQTGTYQLKGKVKTSNGSSNSFLAQLDSNSPVVWALPSPLNSWSWAPGPQVSLTAGAHHLRISYREANAMLDKLELRTRSLSASTGVTPAPTQVPLAVSTTATVPPNTPADTATATATPAPASTAAPPPTSTNPLAATAVGLSNWKLTLPTGSASRPDEISPAELANGYSSSYFTSSAAGLAFWCPVTGVTTGGSSYPRSELREEISGDMSNTNWRYTSFNSTLAATLRVVQMPSTTKIVIGQIHDDGSGGIKSEPLIKLIYDTGNGGEIRADHRNLPTDARAQAAIAIKTNIGPLGTAFSYTINLTKAGALTVQFNNDAPVTLIASLDPSWAAQGLYFKAGAYVQDNVGPDTEGGAVVFTALTVTHS